MVFTVSHEFCPQIGDEIKEKPITKAIAITNLLVQPSINLSRFLLRASSSYSLPSNLKATSLPVQTLLACNELSKSIRKSPAPCFS